MRDHVMSIFLDFRKAFDSVDHTILLSKLYFYGVRGFTYNFLKSYLSNRSQYVSVDNMSSSFSAVTHGVPQGSILGPLLFIIMINDLPNSSNAFKFNLFADDSTLTYKFSPSDVDSIHVDVNNNLSMVNAWLCANRIQSNVSKTKYVIFSYRSNLSSPAISLGGEAVERTDSVKFLGLCLDECLRFDKHVNLISSKISKSLGILNRVKTVLPTHIKINLYYSLIYPYLIYCILSWFAAPNYLTNRISILQKKCIRAIYNLNYNEHTKSYFEKSKVFTIPDLYTRNVLIYVYKTLNQDFDPCLLQHLVRNCDFHSTSTRNRYDFVVPLYKKSTSQNSIVFRGVEAWNKLPLDVRNSSSITSFKKRIDDILLANPIFY